MTDEAYREAARQFRELADRLDKKADREQEHAEFSDWFDNINRGEFEDRLAAMRPHPGKSSGDRDGLTRTLYNLNIEIEINRYRAAGADREKAIKMVAEKANRSADRIEKIYKKQRGGRKSA